MKTLLVTFTVFILFNWGSLTPGFDEWINPSPSLSPSPSVTPSPTVSPTTTPSVAPSVVPTITPSPTPKQITPSLTQVQITSSPTSIQIMPSKMIVGVNIWSGTSTAQLTDRDIPLLTQAGIKHLRTGTGVTDAFVNTLLAAGIDVIGTFGTTGLPDLQAFGDYVYNRVLNFKGRVNAWVVFNEANYDGFNGDSAGYTEALKVAYVRAKQADPNVKIVTTNFLSTEGGLSFLQGMYNAGAKGYFDVLGVDPYCYPVSPLEPNADVWGHTFWGVPKLHDLMVENGDGDKPVWIVEFGHRTPSIKYPLDHLTVVSEVDQADFIVDALELADTWSWLERFYVYEWMDSGDVDLGYWGLIKETYSAPYVVKPSYDAVKQFMANR